MGKPLRDLRGQEFGELIVRELAPSQGYGAMWLCDCSCGLTTIAARTNLVSGHVRSCGHLRSTVTAARSTTHGGASRAGEHYLYPIWGAMKRRCLVETDQAYPLYGGRGIKIDPTWAKSFAAYRGWILGNLGPRPDAPPRMTLDRIDNDGHYEPGNMRWATYSQQRGNRRDS